MAGTDTITVYQGEDAQLNFTMSPVENITGWNIEFTVEGAPRVPKLISKAATISDGVAGTFFVTLADDDTDLRPGRYEYDVWRIDEGSARVLAIGVFIVSDAPRVETG